MGRIGGSFTLQETSYTDEQLYTIMCEAEENGAYVALIRGNLCRTLEDFYKEISAAMRFPSYFGWNWAALDDCIRDLEWLRFSSLLIVIDDFDCIFRRELRPGKYKELLTKHLNMAVDYWNGASVPISVYLNRKT